MITAAVIIAAVILSILGVVLIIWYVEGGAERCWLNWKQWHKQRSKPEHQSKSSEDGGMRPIEMYCCYDDYTWQDGHLVDIPADTPADQVEQMAIDMAKIKFNNPAIVFICVYDTNDDWRN